MAMRVGLCVFSLLHYMTVSERLEEVDVDVDTVGMLQLQTNELQLHPQNPFTSTHLASASTSATEAIESQHLTPNQVTSAIVTALITNAGLNQGEVEHLMSKLDMVALSEGLSEVMHFSSASGALDGQVNMNLSIDPQAVHRVISKWLDHAKVELAREGVESIDQGTMTRILMTIEKGIAKGGLTGSFLETGANSFSQLVAKANGTYAVVNGGQDGPLEVSFRVSGSGLMGMFSSWLGDLATSFEEVGVRDAFIRAGVPEAEEETREARTVSLLGLAASSSEAARESTERATSMVRALLAQTLERPRADR